MPHFRRKAGLARRAALFVLINLFLAACGSGDSSATPTIQNVLGATENNPTAKLSAPMTATVSPITAQPVYSGLAQGKLKEMYLVLSGLAGAKKFRIEDEWTGLSTGGPQKAHYNLELKSGKFEGEGLYSIGGYNWVDDTTRPYFETTRPITIPLDVSQNFLQMLADASVEDGPYKGKPIDVGVDNYPSLNISIETEFGLLEYKSPSNSRAGATKSFFFLGREFNSTDRTVYFALDQLKPYLYKETIGTLSSTPGTSTKEPTTPTPAASPTARK